MTRECQVDNCERPYYTGNYCRAHYEKKRRWGDPLAVMNKAKTPTCHPERKHRALGLCVSCYFRQYRGTEDLPVNRAIYELEASEWLTVKEVAEMLNIDKEWLETQLKARGFVHE